MYTCKINLSIATSFLKLFSSETNKQINVTMKYSLFFFVFRSLT